MSRRTGEFVCLSNTDTPRKFDPLQAIWVLLLKGT